MAYYNSFEEMNIYQLAREQSNIIWFLIQNTTLGQYYKLREQINGSSGSVMDNIAEGFGRGGNKEFINFLSYSIGSCCETKAQLQRASIGIISAREVFRISGGSRYDHRSTVQVYEFPKKFRQ